MATNASAVLTALGDPTRRQAFELLHTRPMSVVELSAMLPVSRPAVSQHLKVLSNAGLVQSTPKGTRRVYAVRREGLLVLRDWVDRIWADGLDRYAAAAHAKHDDDQANPQPIPPTTKDAP